MNKNNNDNNTRMRNAHKNVAKKHLDIIQNHIKQALLIRLRAICDLLHFENVLNKVEGTEIK